MPTASMLSRARRVAAVLLAAAAVPATASSAPLQLTGKIAGPVGETYFAYASGPAGDVNGDGLDDLVVARRERLAVIFGTRDAAGPKLPSAGGAGFEVIAPDPSAGTSAVGAPVGDFDRDGYDDLLITSSTSAFVVYGAAGSATVDLRTSSARATSFGTTVSSGVPGPVGAGDFDGDGYADIVTRAGASGGAILRGGPRIDALSAVTAGPRRIPIAGVRTCYWRALIIYTCSTDLKNPQPVGDVNGDGSDDLYMPDRGFILLGRAGTATISASAPDGKSFSTRGVGGVQSGARPGGVGDVTGDGIDDLLASPGAPDKAWHVIPGRRANSGTLDAAAAVLKIKPAALPDYTWVNPAGDVDGDGRADVVAGVREQIRIISGRSAPATVTLDASTPPLALPFGDLARDVSYDGSLSLAAEAAGDLDGDGAADVAISSPFTDDDGVQNRGALFLLTHGADRLAPALYPRGTTIPELGSSITPSVFAAAPTGAGTSIRINVLEPAAVELRVRRAGGAVLSTETRAGLPAGVTTIAWDGRGRGVDGAPGKYELELVAIDASGNRSAAQVLPFEVTGSADVTPPVLRITRREVVPAGATVQPPRNVYPYGDPSWRRVDGDCPDSIVVTSLTETPRDVTLNDPHAGDRCALIYMPPPATDNGGYPPVPAAAADYPWKTTASINGGAPVDITAAVNGHWTSLPAFTLRNGVNTVELVDRWDDSGLQIREADVTGTLAWSFPASGGGFANAASGDPASAAGLQLTPATANQIGIAVACPSGFSPNAMSVEFDAEITGGSGAGHGLAFAVFDRRPAALLASNANVGFGWVGHPGTAFGLITAKERYNPANNFVGIASGVPGKSGYPTWLASSIQARSLSGTTTRVRISVGAGTAVLSIDGSEVLRRAVTFPAGACLGFTGATGTRTQRHLVKNLRVRSAI